MAISVNKLAKKLRTMSLPDEQALLKEVERELKYTYADGLAEKAAGRLMGQVEKRIADLERWEARGLFGNAALGRVAEGWEAGVSKVTSPLKKSGKLLLLGGAVAGGVALLSGMFGGRSKKGVSEASYDAEREAQAADASLPSPTAMVAAPSAGPEALLPPGVAPQPGALANAVRPNGALTAERIAAGEAGLEAARSTLLRL